MSDEELTPSKLQPRGVKEGNFAGMQQQDVDFLVACLTNTINGQIVINTAKVAEALDYKNPRSVTNRLKQIRDRYGLNISGSSKTADAFSASQKKLDEGDDTGNTAVKNPKTRAAKASPAKKTRATPAAKDTPVKASAAKKRKAVEESAEDADVSANSESSKKVKHDENDDEDEDEDDDKDEEIV